jgi:dienelactone hydrolase
MMKEEVFSLPLGDGHSLYGRINKAEKPARKAVILCHGLTGHMYEHQYMLARTFFTERGYDVIRFNFYGEEPDARRITDCTVALHAKDLERVLGHFAPQYESLCVTGHSFGGLAVLMADSPHIAAASLWDGTFIPFAEDKNFSKAWSYNKDLGEYMVNWLPIAKVVGKNFYDETRTFTSQQMEKWAKKFDKPVQVIAAGAFNENVPYQKKMFETLAAVKKEYTSIEGASHGFNEGDAVFKLLENTHSWFERALAPQFNKAARKDAVQTVRPVPVPVQLFRKVFGRQQRNRKTA